MIGAGPAGCSAALTLSRRGIQPTVIERISSSDELPMRALLLDEVALQCLAECGIDTAMLHHMTRVRFSHRHHHRVRELHKTSAGVLSERALSARLREACEASGSDVRMGVAATAPYVERGFVRGAILDDGSVLRSEFVVIADGANSTFGRSLGTYRRRDIPYLLAIAATFESSHASRSEFDVLLDLERSEREPVAGYGWVVPDGVQSVTVGIVIPSTVRDVEAVNLADVLGRAVRSIAPRWEIDPDRPISASRSRRLPVGGSVLPIAGPTFVVAGDAAASADPLSGIGVGGALVSGTCAGTAVADAIDAGASAPLQNYTTLIREAFGQRQRIGRVALPILGHQVGQRALTFAARSHIVAEALLRATFDR